MNGLRASMTGASRALRTATIATLLALSLSGCGSIAGGMADSLSGAVLDQDDPALVRDGLPSYLLLLDALIDGDPDNPRYLGAAAELYSAYAIGFVEDRARQAVLTARAREYGARALCNSNEDGCDLDALEYEAYGAALQRLENDDANALFSYCVGSLAWIRGHSDDWSAVAVLPKVESALQRLLTLESGMHAGNVNLYLGIMATLRPPALGGKPEEGRIYFEKALELSGGHDLSAKVEYARSYARLVYDRELHDRLLNEVVAAPARHPRLTLFNTLAQAQARELLASADEYF